MTLKVTVPDNYVGDVMGDLNKRRGRVHGHEPHRRRRDRCCEAEVPMAEMTELRHRSAVHDPVPWQLHLCNFVRYEDCPAAAQEKAIAEAKALADAE